MAVLNYSIQGDNSSLLSAIKQAIAGIVGAQSAVDRLNRTSLGGIAGGFNTAAQSANNFSNAARRGTQSFSDQQISNALDRLNVKLSVANGNFQLFGASVKNSQQTLFAYQQALNSLLANGVAPTDARIVAFKGHIDDLTSSIAKQKAASSGGGSSLGGFSDLTGGLASLASSYLSVYAIVAGVKKVIQSNAEISDSLADIRRTAALTQPEVEGLFESLKKIDTRTSLKGLADIAIIGGQLGIAKDQLAGFTKAVDELSVSLSGELKGGPEAVAQSLGILDKVFSVSAQNGGDVEKSFNKIGSVILGLGQSGLATGDFLTDFAKRVGGVAAQAKLDLPVLLSYGAVLQEQGVTAEVAGTAFKKLLGSLAIKREAFLPIAQIADSTLTLKSFTDIINNDTQRALSLFFEGLAKGGATTTAFSDLLKSVGLDAARSGQAITALALHHADLNVHIQESTQQYKDGTIAAEQFNIKNDTLGASVDKLGKSFVTLTTSGAISNFFKIIIDGLNASLSGLQKLSDSLALLTKIRSFDDALTPFQALPDKFAIQDKYKSSNATRKDFNPTGATDDILKLALDSSSQEDLKKEITKYQKATQDALDAVNIYKKNIKKGLLSDGGDVSVAEATKNYEGLRKILNLLSSAYVTIRDKSEAAKTTIVKNSTEIADSELKTVKAINARILELKNDALANPNNAAADIARIDALRERLAQFATRSKSAIGGSFLSISQSLDDIFNKTNALSNQSGLKGYDLEVQKVVDTYIELNKQIDDNVDKAVKANAKGGVTNKQLGSVGDSETTNTVYGKANRDRADATRAKEKELSDLRVAETQRVANEVQRINNDFGVKAEQSRSREILQINARYDAEVIKAQGNAEILAALDQGRLTAIQAVNDKYLAISQDLQDKIVAINDLALATIQSREDYETQRIENEWNRRKQAAQDYYDKLKEISKTGNPAVDAFNNLIIGAQATVTGKNIDEAKKRDANAVLNKDLNQAIGGFLNDFTSGLFQANSQVGANFKTVFAGITQSFASTIQSVVVTKLSKSLEEGINKGVSGLAPQLQKIIGGLAVAGGIISGLTPKTSTVGQGLGGALSGAATGAAIGSAIPVLGTIAGGVIGGIAGALGGIFGSSSARKEEEERQKQMLEEQKKQTALLSLSYTSQIIGRDTSQGVVTDISVGAYGQLTATISGKDLQFILDRNANGR